MLNKITLDRVASFRSEATLSTDKKVNLIYGLHGSGKSTLSRFLRAPLSAGYEHCSLQGGEGARIIVFNEDFIRENFFESESVPGIFSLSKRNSDAERLIERASVERERIKDELARENAAHEERAGILASKKVALNSRIFEIKRKYSGGDRVLEYCLEGVMGSKERLVEKLTATELPAIEPGYDVPDLQDRARLLSSSVLSQEDLLPLVEVSLSHIEGEELLRVPIVGVSSDEFGEFIAKLGISDWVQEGRAFIEPTDHPAPCPFCQKATIDSEFVRKLDEYFNVSYLEKIARVSGLVKEYEREFGGVPSYERFENGLFYSPEVTIAMQALSAQVEANLLLLRRKIESPSECIQLSDTAELLANVNTKVESVNRSIQKHNRKLADKAAELQRIKREFWSLMRWTYRDQVEELARHAKEGRDLEARHANQGNKLRAELGVQDRIIVDARRSTINIDDAVEKINSELVSIGITDFSLLKYESHLYRLTRGGEDYCDFRTLSEGEKTIISFLYFCEMIVGNQAEDELPSERIVVLDDPVSSLSHIYLFNVGRLILGKIFRSADIAQVFVLTHSLYFFYELTDTDQGRRKETQALFRIFKGGAGSGIATMKYEELQNDYHSYWQVVNDSSQSPALLANCMRNIVEYFFGFVERQSFANVFQKPELSGIKFQAFNRYMNRESHSFGQNVFDIKEFDYDVFREGLRLVFDVCGYGKHYEKMAKI